MPPIANGGGAAAIKVAVAVISRFAPTGLSLIKSWFKGKEILLVGQSRAGKTTFMDYLAYGLFEDEKPTEKTYEESPQGRFNVKLGRDGALELIVQDAVDLPGQWGPMKHADLAFKRRPHAILVFTDLTTSLDGEDERASARWLREFCRRLESKWRTKRLTANRLKAMIVVMNKADKAAAGFAGRCKDRYRGILDAELRQARGRMEEEIRIMPCSVVTNPRGTKDVDSIIAQLAKLLAR